MLSLFLVSTAAGCATTATRPATTHLTQVPVYAADARATDLVALAAGRPIVVDFFASWCEGCRDNLGPMNALVHEHGDEVLVVGVDVGEDPAVAHRYAAREGMGYPIFTDPEMRFQDSLGTSALPLVLVVDGRGQIVHRSVRLDATAVEAIRSLRAEGPGGSARRAEAR